MKKYNDEKNLLVRTAWYYYKHDLTQNEVGEKLGLSRQKIQRLLEKAREKNVIRVEISSPLGNLLSVEETLATEYHLKDVVVVPSESEDDEEMTREALGKSASSYLKRLLAKNTDIKTVGIGWGRTLSAFSRNLTSQTEENKNNPVEEVTSLIGNLLGDTSVNPYSIATTLANKLNANCYHVLAPAIVQSNERAEMFKSEPWVKGVLDKASSSDLVVISVGTPNSDKATIHQLGFLSNNELRDLQSQGAVGDILAQYYNKNGNLVSSDRSSNHVIAMPINKLQDIDNVILVAGNEYKTEAIKGAIENGFANILITDEIVANQLLT